MEVRMQPRSDGRSAACASGSARRRSSRVMMYQDHDGNIVHHFNIPGRHCAADGHRRSARRVRGGRRRCRDRSAPDAWAQLDAAPRRASTGRLLHPSTFARSTPRLDELRERAAARTRQRSARHAAPAHDGDLSNGFDLQPEEHARRFADRRCAARRGRACARTSRTS